MKKLLIWLLAILPALASAVPFETFIDRKSATNSAINPIVIPPPSADAIYFFEKANNQPKLTLLGPGLSITSGVLNVSLSSGDVGAADAVHSHVISDVTGLTTELSDRVLTTDSRLSDARYPTAHTHGYSDLAGVDPAGAASSAQAYSVQRGNHSGTQPASTISDFDTAVDARVAAGITGKENTITAGTTVQVYRGDKTWVAANKALVGLPNVDDTSDINKPISTATQTALNGKLTIPTGTASQVVLGNATLGTLPVPQEIQRIRVQTDASGNYTWTYPMPYGSGVVPVITAVSESASSTVPQGVQIVGVPTNTSATFKVINLPSTSVVGIVVLGAPTAAQAYIHLTAVAP